MFKSSITKFLCSLKLSTLIYHLEKVTLLHSFRQSLNVYEDKKKTCVLSCDIANLMYISSALGKELISSQQISQVCDAYPKEEQKMMLCTYAFFVNHTPFFGIHFVIYFLL